MIEMGDEVTFLYDVGEARRRRGEGRVTAVDGDYVTIDVYPAPNATLIEIETSIVGANVRVLS